MGNTPKRYKLLKDTPVCKADTIFQWDDEFGWYKAVDVADKHSETGKLLKFGYTKELVENNPEWFEEVTEQPAPSPIKITDLKFYKKYADPRINECWYQFKASDFIHEEKLQSLSRVMEGFLNGYDTVKSPRYYKSEYDGGKSGVRFIHDEPGQWGQLPGTIPSFMLNELSNVCKDAITTISKIKELRKQKSETNAKEQPEFQWTDELVCEFTSWSLTKSPTFQGRYSDIEQFKKFKATGATLDGKFARTTTPATAAPASPVQEGGKDIIEVEVYRNQRPNNDLVVKLSKPVSGEMFAQIKPTLEKILNKESTICGNCGFDSSLHIAPKFECPK